MILGLCLASIASYVVINLIILAGTSSPWDVLYLLASCMYSVTFAMRNIKLMRYVIIIPHVSAIMYNVLIKAPFSSALSYGIELAVTIVAIIKFKLQELSENKK